MHSLRCAFSLSCTSESTCSHRLLVSALLFFSVVLVACDLRSYLVAFRVMFISAMEVIWTASLCVIVELFLGAGVVDCPIRPKRAIARTVTVNL